MPATVAILEASDSYRRQARRLRCRFAGQPDRLQHALKGLAGTTATRPAGAASRTQRVLPRRLYPACAPSGPARSFADYLVDRTSGRMTVLRYSQRLEFLRVARRFGVGRFEANLLIAALLEQRRARVEETEASEGGSLVSNLAALLVVESALLLGAWWVMFH